MSKQIVGGTRIALTVDKATDRFIDRYAETYAISRADAVRELLQVAREVSRVYKIAVQQVRTRS